MIKLQHLRNALKQGLPSIGAWQMTKDINITSAMASLGFDWLVIDLEHTTINLSDAEAIIYAAELYNVIPMARLANDDPYTARRLLDAGIKGLLIPGVEDADKLTSFIKHCYYPVTGCRGLGLTRVNMWGDELDEYIREFNPFIVPQIETPRGVEQLRKIVRVDGVDAVFIGPYDLSANMGIHGQINHPDMKYAMDDIRKICQESGIAVGIHQVDPDLDKLESCIEDGYKFIAYSTDIISMRKAMGGFRKIIKK